MLTTESETKTVAEAVDAGKIKVQKTFRDYLVDICCWIIDAVVKAVTFVITGVMLMVGGALYFVITTILKIAFGIAMLLITCWIVGALLKICWMIWGPKNL